MESMFISNRLFPIETEKVLIEVINFGRNSKVESLQDTDGIKGEDKKALKEDLLNLKSVLETLDKMLESWNGNIPCRAIDFIEHLDNFSTIISDLNLFNLLEKLQILRPPRQVGEGGPPPPKFYFFIRFIFSIFWEDPGSRFAYSRCGQRRPTSETHFYTVP